MKTSITYILLLLFPLFVFAQETKIEGKVYDLMTDGPIQDATIKVLNASNYTTTDANGLFSIKTSESTQLEISHLNYETKIINAIQGLQIALTAKKNSLAEILISANPLEDITHSITVLDNIKKGSQPRNAAELFNDINGFSIQKRSAMASEPSLRAFKYEQMNIKIDGSTKICSACPNRMDPITSHIIPEEVGKIEVVKGPYTVRFGQTFGGIVNMVTSSPGEIGLHGNVQSGYEWNGKNKIFRGELQYSENKYDLTINGEYRDFGDYKDGNGNETPAGFNTVSYSVKTGFVPAKNHRLQLDWRQKFGKDIDHSGLPMDSPKDDSYVVALDYNIENISKTITNFSAKSFYTYVDHLMTNGNRPNFVMMDAQTPVQSNSMGGKIELTLRPSDQILIYTGIDAEIINRDGERTRIIKKNMMGVDLTPPLTKIDKVWQDATTKDIGVFAEGTFKISQNYSVTGGIRTDFVQGDIKDPAPRTTALQMGTTVPGFEELYGEGFDKVNENTVAGNLGFKYHQNGTQVQLAYGLGVRSASMLERYIYHFTIGTDSYEYVGNPFLKPEKNNQIELALNHKKDRLNIGFGIFYSKMIDFISAEYKVNNPDFAIIFSNSNPYAKQFVNVDAHQMGFDAFFGYRILENIFFNTSIAYTEAQNDTFNEPLALISPFTANFSIKYETEKMWADVRSQVVSPQYRLATSFGETTFTPGYTTFDVRAGMTVYKGLNFGASILNIFDTAYYNHLNFSYNNAFNHINGEKVYEPGRNVSLYVVYKF